MFVIVPRFRRNQCQIVINDVPSASVQFIAVSLQSIYFVVSPLRQDLHFMIKRIIPLFRITTREPSICEGLKVPCGIHFNNPNKNVRV